MLQKLNFKLLSLFVLISISIGFYACEQNDPVTPQSQDIETSLFKKHLEDNTQRFNASDLGEGTYQVTGEQGTTININNALVNTAGERVRGNVDIVLIEIYTVADMILNRKQTLADYDGQLGILESGGEVFVKVYQNGEELFADGNGTMNILLPTENTGGAKEGMELFYGEEIGDQVIWKPTGEVIRVVTNEARNESEYLIIIQNTLGWLNVDILSQLEGEFVECVEVIIECPEICEGEPGHTVVAMHVNSMNSAFELTYDSGTNSYRLCSNERPLNIGGITVTFIVAIECPNGQTHVAIVTTTVNPGSHTEVISCEGLTPMSPDEFEDALLGLL